MAIKVAINGYGRIGRNILRALYESGRTDQFQIVAINDLGNAETNAHLTQYDTAHGRFPGTVSAEDGFLVVNGDKIKVFAERDPAKLPWGDLGVDVVLECTGLFTSKAKASAHLAGGAKKVIISAPGDKDVDGTFVYGVNHDGLKAEHTVISNASCTTNCLAPLAKVLHEEIGIVHGLMTTIHAYTNDQVLTDVYHSDLRRARSATMSQIPTKTGAAAAVGLVLPELNGKLDGFAMRVPTINVSVVDLCFVAARSTKARRTCCWCSGRPRIATGWRSTTACAAPPPAPRPPSIHRNARTTAYFAAISAAVMSSMRLEKPHSLSYHEHTFTSVPPMTWVSVAS